MNRRAEEVRADRPLTAQQLKAALYYAVHGNVTRAARHAGYASRAHVSRLLREPHIAEFVARVREGLVDAGARAQEAEKDLEWGQMVVHARALLHALVTGGLRETSVDPRLLRVELDAAREVVLRAEGAVPQTVLVGDLAHMHRISEMSDEELEQFRLASPHEQARLLGIEDVPPLLLAPGRVDAVAGGGERTCAAPRHA